MRLVVGSAATLCGCGDPAPVEIALPRTCSTALAGRLGGSTAEPSTTSSASPTLTSSGIAGRPNLRLRCRMAVPLRPSSALPRPVTNESEHYDALVHRRKEHDGCFVVSAPTQ